MVCRCLKLFERSLTHMYRKAKPDEILQLVLHSRMCRREQEEVPNAQHGSTSKLSKSFLLEKLAKETKQRQAKLCTSNTCIYATYICQNIEKTMDICINHKKLKRKEKGAKSKNWKEDRPIY